MLVRHLLLCRPGEALQHIPDLEVAARIVPSADPDFGTNAARVQRRHLTDHRVAAAFASMDIETLSAKLVAADIAFARINDMAGLAAHPHLRRITLQSPGGPISYPAPAPRRAGETRHYAGIPALGEHTEQVRAEFLGGKAR